MFYVLLLEDSKLDAQIVAGQLEDAGLPTELIRVESREAFSHALAEREFEIILSDYNVPGFGGDEALALARALRPEVPFIFVSGALGEHTAIDLLKRGATDYVLKDQLERLVPSIERALREAREKLERQRAEEKLRERERTLSTLMSNLPGLAFRRTSVRPWRLEFASDGCRALTGYDAEAFYRSPALVWDALVHPADLERVVAEARGAFERGAQLTTTYRIRTQAGEERWVWERSVAQERWPEAGSSVEGFAIDITQQREAEAEVERRIEFEQQLIGIVSHDLRNPLNSITLGAATLLKQEGLNPAGTKAVRRILASAERAARMIRDLLDFTQARLGGGIPVVKRPCELRGLLAQVVEEFEHTHADRELVLQPVADVVCAWDPDRMTQAITNLISNALSYSPTDSTVTVHSYVQGEAAVVEVHNVGAPIPSERLPTLFKPLSRGHAGVDLSTRSIGLGLYIVQSIVRAHGGTVHVRSNAADGTTFALHVPMHMEEHAP
jgi:phosphoserine phosphatase RsbU/P